MLNDASSTAAATTTAEEQTSTKPETALTDEQNQKDNETAEIKNAFLPSKKEPTDYTDARTWGTTVAKKTVTWMCKKALAKEIAGLTLRETAQAIKDCINNPDFNTHIYKEAEGLVATSIAQYQMVTTKHRKPAWLEAMKNIKKIVEEIFPL